MRHYGYSRNLPNDVVVSFAQEVVDGYRTAWWNRSFDFSMLELDGFRCPFVGQSHDIQFMAHEMFNEEYPKLKDFAKRLLGFQTILFEDNAATNNDFGTTDPEVTFIYAGGDAVITALLGLRIWDEYPLVHQIYSLDILCGEAVRRLTQTPIRLDYDFLDSEVRRSTSEMLRLEQEIYTLVGYPFNVNSGRECADALSRFVTLTVKTKKGEWKVDKTILSSIDHPLAKLLLSHSAVSTYLKSFVKKMSSWRKLGPIRLNYNLVVALTGRMSSSASSGNDYYAPLNSQNIPKVEEKWYLHEHPHMGYCLRPESEGCVCGEDGSPVRYKTKAGLRKAIVSDDGGREDSWVFLGLDYCVHPDTMVRVKGRGFIRIGDLVGQDVEVHTPYGYRRATNIHHTGLRTVVEIGLSDGKVLRCSEEHRLWVNRDGLDCWVRVKDLVGTEYIYTIDDSVSPDICV